MTCTDCNAEKANDGFKENTRTELQSAYKSKNEASLLIDRMPSWILALTFVVLVLFRFLFLQSGRVRFYTKIFLHNANLTLSGLLPLPLALLRPKDVRNYNYFAFVLRNLSKMFGITWKVKGMEHMPKEKAAIIVCNHQSSLDVVGMMQIWQKIGRAAPVAKAELKYSGPFGWLTLLSGGVFVERGNSAQARAALNNSLTYLTNKNIKIWLFPEGTRNEGETFLPFKKGAFHMALQAQVPIVPVVISSYSSFYSTKQKKFDNGGQVTMQILPPVPTTGLTVNDMTSLIASVRDPMLQTYKELSGFKPDVVSNEGST